MSVYGNRPMVAGVTIAHKDVEGTSVSRATRVCPTTAAVVEMSFGVEARVEPFKVSVASKLSKLGMIGLLLPLALLAACGTSKSNPTPTPPPTTPQYPQTPPLPITWTPASPLPAPPACQPVTSSCAPPDYPAGSDDFPLTVSSPSTGATVTSPATVVASASPTNPIFFMRVYVDQLAVYFTFDNSINTQIFMAPGKHTMEIFAEDNQGFSSAAILTVTVSSQPQTTITSIQDLSGWQQCSAKFPANSGRAGQICAAGLGDAVSTMTPNQSSPALDGKSAQFTMGGPTGYSNELYFNAVAGGTNVSHFIYDLYFYVDNPDLPQALEFDINQTFGGVRWVWGSECNFKGETPPAWDIWDDVNGWTPTSIPCNPFPANSWIHLVWNVERVGQQVHYISLTVGDQTYQVDKYFDNTPNWTLEEIDVAFQMDGDYAQQPYNVWLDEVDLTAY